MCNGYVIATLLLRTFGFEAGLPRAGKLPRPVRVAGEDEVAEVLVYAEVGPVLAGVVDHAPEAGDLAALVVPDDLGGRGRHGGLDACNPY